MQFISWVEMQRLMTWWHDDMMQCKNKRASTKETHGDHENMEVFWSVGLGASQHSSTYKRSRGWHRRENGRGKGKTKLLLWQTSETKEPWEVKQFLEKNTMEVNEITNTPLEKENKEHYENLVGWKTWNKGITNQNNFEPHRYNEIAKEQEWHNFDSTPVEKEKETW